MKKGCLSFVCRLVNFPSGCVRDGELQLHFNNRDFTILKNLFSVEQLNGFS